MRTKHRLVLAPLLALLAACHGDATGADPTPRIQGRVTLASAQGDNPPSGLSLSIDDGTPHSITSADGSFSFPSSKAQSADTKLLFTANGAAAPSLVRAKVGAVTNVVMLPSQITIPSCSVYGGRVVALDLDKAFAVASDGQTGFFDRAGTLRANSKVVVASWTVTSIPVAFSDTGDVSKRFSTQDSSEVMTTLATLTSYVCQQFRLASLAEASAGGVVFFRDPTFTALGAHSMALPSTRGDFTRADVVVRTVIGNGAARDSTRRTIMHEFMHVLGFGHTCSWKSVMTTGTTCLATSYSLVPSPEDVAHYFAMQYARRSERSLSSLQSVGPAYVALVVASGQTDFQLFPYYGQP
jgi:hypothetical protein